MKITRKIQDQLPSLLEEWHGKEEGRGALVRFHPEPAPLQTVIEKIIRKAVPPWERQLNALKSSWVEIAGEETARRCQVSHLNNAVLYIEVFHPAYRITLETPKIKDLLLAKVRRVLGEEKCRELKFIPAGRGGPVRRTSKNPANTPDLPF